MVVQMIRTHIVALDDWKREQKEDQEAPAPGEDDDDKAAAWTFNSIYLGSRCPAVSIATFVEQSDGDPAFVDFVSQLQSCMRDILIREHFDACERDRNLLREQPPLPVVSEQDMVRLHVSNLLYPFLIFVLGYGMPLREDQLRAPGGLATSFGSCTMQSVVSRISSI